MADFSVGLTEDGKGVSIRIPLPAGASDQEIIAIMKAIALLVNAEYRDLGGDGLEVTNIEIE